MMEEEKSAAAAHKVAIVVDRHFGRRLMELAPRRHVWIVDSGSNTPAILEFWASEQPDPGGDPAGPGVTAFQAPEEETPAAMCARISDEVESHHGEFAHAPPWSEIAVIGVVLDAHLESVFSAFGATRFVDTSDGFVVCR